MLLSARSLPDAALLTADVCIVGAGPAGITLARALRGRNLRILLIEAGDVKGPGKAQPLYRGHNTRPAFHQPPDSDRTRGLGGTSAMWGGRCMPYDPQDFAPRPHVAQSGWPFVPEVLAPYYRVAQQMAECGDWAYLAGEAGLSGDMIEGAATDALRIDSLERWSPPTHFGKAHRAELQAALDVTVLSGAVVTGLDMDKDRVAGLVLSETGGKRRLRAEAAQVVLAGGGLEVPRLLMHSAAPDRPAIGDHSGWLGRGYMCHVGGVIARLRLAAGRKVIFGYEQDAQGVYVRRRLTLSAKAQAEHALPNIYALLDRPLLDDAAHGSALLSLAYLAKSLLQRQSRSDVTEGRFAHYRRHLRNLLFGAPEVLSVLPRFGRKRFLSGRRVPSLLLRSRDNSFYLYFQAEQSPHRESRLTLHPQTDALGMRQLEIDTKLSETDAQGILRAHRLIGAELERTGAGRMEFLGPDPMALLNACKCTLGHHIGATRMAQDPEDGVVDPDARVFGTTNLYVCGASVLPTSSQAHPTLTVIALALKLADHLGDATVAQSPSGAGCNAPDNLLTPDQQRGEEWIQQKWAQPIGLPDSFAASCLALSPVASWRAR